MKRLVWGIVVAGFGLLSCLGAGSNPQGPTNSIVGGILFLAGGGVLIYFGATYLKARNQLGDWALAMLRETSKIDGAELASRLRLPEVKVREMIADLQRRSVIPFKVDIV